MNKHPWGLYFLILAIIMVIYYTIDEIRHPENYSSEDSYYEGAPAPWSSGPYSD